MKKRILGLFCFVMLFALVLCACSRSDKVCEHALTETPYKAATCTENGNEGYWECSRCNKKFTDETAETEITDVVIPASHAFGEYEYDYEQKKYTRVCSVCKFDESIIAGTAEYPLLVRDETELAQVVAAAAANSFIKLKNDIDVTTGMYEVITRLPEGGTLDFGGHTVTVKVNGGFVVEGTNVTLQNGTVITDFANPKEGYALFIGDEGENNRVVVKNVNSKGGFNVYNCVATLYDCNVDASAHRYYALWGDAHSAIYVESGVYRGGEIACVHSTSGEASDNEAEDGRGRVIFNGGEFHGKIVATDLTVINGGEFDGQIAVSRHTANGNLYEGKLVVGKDYAKELDIVSGSTEYALTSNFDADGNTVYCTEEKTQTGETN